MTDVDREGSAVGRRVVVAGILGWVADKATGGAVEGAAWDLLKASGNYVTQALPRRLPFSPALKASRRLRVLRERVLPTSGTRYLAPGDVMRRISGETTQPDRSHDRLALAPLAALHDVNHLEIDIIQMIMRSADSIVCSGSPVANDVTAEYLPVIDMGQDPSPPRKLKINRDAVPYHFVTGVEGSAKVFSGAWGKVMAKRSNAVFDVEANAIRHPQPHTTRDGFLAADLLIVQRMPRNLEGGELLAVAGLHGPGTQAFELLFDPAAFPESEISFLEQRIGNEPYFQVILEVSDVSHAAPMSVAKSLRVSRLMPPKPIRFTPDLFTG
ncbi:MAG TPA: hypothetical protein VJ691_13620 [Vicinamibacterales bacterium]|nr:hypothetical protein [Vicinamibacterales bacterium]